MSFFPFFSVIDSSKLDELADLNYNINKNAFQ